MVHLKLPRVRIALATTVTTALSVALLAPSASAAPSSSAAETAVAAPSVPWRPCRDGFECATVPVPLDYDDPLGAQIAIAVIRLPAGDPAQRIGSLMLNPGG